MKNISLKDRSSRSALIKLIFLITFSVTLISLPAGCLNLMPEKKQSRLKIISPVPEPTAFTPPAQERTSEDAVTPSTLIEIDDIDFKALSLSMGQKALRLEELEASLQQTGYPQKSIESITFSGEYYRDIAKQADMAAELMARFKKDNDADTSKESLLDTFNKILPDLFKILQQSKPYRYSPNIAEGGRDELSEQVNHILLQEMSHRFKNKSYQAVCNLYQAFRDISNLDNLPFLADFYYHAACYELGDKVSAGTFLEKLINELPPEGYVSLQMKLGKWFTSKKNLDLAIKPYGNIVDYVTNLEKKKDYSQEAVGLIADIRAPLEAEIFSLVDNAERDFYEYKELKAAHRGCMEALHIMTSHGLYEGPYFSKCEQILDAIREEEHKVVKDLLDAADQLAHKQKQFAQAREILTEYLSRNPETDFKKDLNLKIDQIYNLENIYADEDCRTKIDHFQKTYHETCLQQVAEGDYEQALPCLTAVIDREDHECFDHVAEIAETKKAAAEKKKEVQAYYIQGQLKKAAGLFTKAKRMNTTGKKKDYLLRSYYILNKLEANYPENQYSSKIIRYISTVEKEIKQNFPELLEKPATGEDENEAGGGDDQLTGEEGAEE